MERFLKTIGAMGVMVLLAGPVFAGTSGGENASSSRPEHRFPEDVRSEAIPFSGDLDPIEANLSRKLLSKLCPRAPERHGDDQASGWVCTVCPSFTSRAGESETWRLTHAVRGGFFEPKSKEIFAVYQGCEGAHAAGGGAVVFRKRRVRKWEGSEQKRTWEAIYRHPGLNPQQCLSFESSKHHDRLICRVRAESADGKIHQRVMAIGGDNSMHRLLYSLDNTGTCPDKRFVSSYIAGWRRGDADGDGTAELTIEKIQRWRVLDEKKSVCTFAEAGGKWSRHRRIEFVYQFDGKSLTRTDVRTEEISATLESEKSTEQAKNR